MIGNIYIPIDISKQIFNYLEYKDIINFSLISQGGLNLVNTYRDTPEFYIRSLNGVQDHFESVEKIIEFVIEKSHFNQIKLENLNLSYFEHEMDDESFMNIINHINLVGTLIIHNVSHDAIRINADKLESLKKLVWKKPSRYKFCNVINFTLNIDRLINLEELELLVESSAACDSQLQKLPNLKKLTIEGYVDEQTLLKFISVEEIHLKNNPRLRNTAIQTLLGKENLKSLTIENCPRVTQEFFENAKEQTDIEMQLINE